MVFDPGKTITKRKHTKLKDIHREDWLLGEGKIRIIIDLTNIASCYSLLWCFRLFSPDEAYKIAVLSCTSGPRNKTWRSRIRGS